MAIDMDAVMDAFKKFCATVASLRDPKTGCPWDLQQTHETLRRYMLEEAYEAAHAMQEGDAVQICDELGDVLLQVILNAQIAADNGLFTIVDVIRSIDAKMRRRHPHVFSELAGIETAEQVRKNWDEIKAQEKPKNIKAHYFAKQENLFPATLQAFEIGKHAARIKFDWPSSKEVWLQFKSEVEELEVELTSSGFILNERLYKELGDCYFSLAQLCRHFALSPEVVAVDGNKKFLQRFSLLESLSDKPVGELSSEELEVLWLAAKKREINK